MQERNQIIERLDSRTFVKCLSLGLIKARFLVLTGDDVLHNSGQMPDLLLRLVFCSQFTTHIVSNEWCSFARSVCQGF